MHWGVMINHHTMFSRDTVINIKVASKQVNDRKHPRRKHKTHLEWNKSVHLTSKIIFLKKAALLKYNWYTKMYGFKVYNLMSLDIDTHPWNHHHWCSWEIWDSNQDIPASKRGIAEQQYNGKLMLLTFPGSITSNRYIVLNIYSKVLAMYFWD